MFLKKRWWCFGTPGYERLWRRPTHVECRLSWSHTLKTQTLARLCFLGPQTYCSLGVCVLCVHVHSWLHRACGRPISCLYETETRTGFPFGMTNQRAVCLYGTFSLVKMLFDFQNWLFEKHRWIQIPKISIFLQVKDARFHTFSVIMTHKICFSCTKISFKWRHCNFFNLDQFNWNEMFESAAAERKLFSHKLQMSCSIVIPQISRIGLKLPI